MPLGLLPETKRSEALVSEAPPLPPGASSAPPSYKFRDATEVRAAWPMSRGPFARASRGGTAAQRAGKRYEKKALDFLKKSLGVSFIPSPWFRYEDKWGNLRYCQPDGLLLSEKASTIFEIKVSFCPDAWWQLRRLYEPVVRRAYMLPSVAHVVVCKSFDPAVPFPEPTVPLDAPPTDAEWAREGDCTRIGVLQWTP